MSEYRRAVCLDTSAVNEATGEFSCTLFSNGEASDGHVIDVRSLDVPATIPMFVDHVADPVRRAGRMHSPVKFGPGRGIGDSVVKMTGRVDLEGEGREADIRRDLFHGIAVGDVSSVSGRWRSSAPPTPRAELRESHFAHRSGAGFYFENAVALEGSIVGLGADPSALIGRSQDETKPEHVRDFWRSWSDSGDSETALAVLAANARQIPGLVPVQTGVGEFYVPADLATLLARRASEEHATEPAHDPLEGYISLLERINDGFAEQLSKRIEDGIRDTVAASQIGKI